MVFHEVIQQQAYQAPLHNFMVTKIKNPDEKEKDKKVLYSRIEIQSKKTYVLVIKFFGRKIEWYHKTNTKGCNKNIVNGIRLFCFQNKRIQTQLYNNNSCEQIKRYTFKEVCKIQ